MMSLCCLDDVGYVSSLIVEGLEIVFCRIVVPGPLLCLQTCILALIRSLNHGR